MGLLIEEISSSNDHTEENQHEEESGTVESLVSLLVEHYRQPIHHITDLKSTRDETSKVVNHLLARLDAFRDSSVAIPELFQTYSQQIDPCIFDQQKRLCSISGLSVLYHYERLVSEHLASNRSNKDSRQQINVDEEQSISTSLSQVLLSISCGLTFATSFGLDQDEESLSTWRTTVVMPSLVRFALELVQWTTESGIQLQVDACAVSFLALRDGQFRSGWLDPREVDATLEKSLCDLKQYSQTIYLQPAAAVAAAQVPVLSDMDWQSVQLDGSAWQPSSYADVAAVWQHLSSQLSLGDTSDSDKEDFSVASVVNKLGVLAMAKAVRAHFFGRDMPAETKLEKRVPRERLHLGRVVKEGDKPVASIEKAYIVIPSRVHVAAHFISLLRRDWPYQADVVQEILPICFELLSGTTNEIMAMGATVLFHLLQQSDATASWLADQADHLLSLLDMILKTCRHGPTLALLGLAERHLFLSLLQRNNASSSSYAQRRRQTTQQWLLLLDRNRHNADLVWGVLVGGVLPLLHDHAHYANADAMEVGRLGLSALLPLLRSDDQWQLQTSGTEIVVAALLALAHLLVAAHPIMSRHAEKLVYTLLPLAVRTDNDDKNCEKEEDVIVIRQLALQVIVVGTKVGGARAREVLQALASDPTLAHEEGLQSTLTLLLGGGT